MARPGLEPQRFVVDRDETVSAVFERACSHIVRTGGVWTRTGNELQTIVASGIAVELSRDDLPVRAGVLRALAYPPDQASLLQGLQHLRRVGSRSAEKFGDLSGAKPAGVA